MVNREIGKRVNMKAYLRELAELLGREVNESELLNLEETERISYRSRKFDSWIAKNWEFDYMESANKLKIILELFKHLNSSKIFLWIPLSLECGCLTLDSLDEINVSNIFKDDLTISIVTTDMKDKVLIDFTIDADQHKLVQLEILGENWSNIRLENVDFDKTTG